MHKFVRWWVLQCLVVNARFYPLTRFVSLALSTHAVQMNHEHAPAKQGNNYFDSWCWKHWRKSKDGKIVKEFMPLDVYETVINQTINQVRSFDVIGELEFVFLISILWIRALWFSCHNRRPCFGKPEWTQRLQTSVMSSCDAPARMPAGTGCLASSWCLLVWNPDQAIHAPAQFSTPQ